MMPANDIYNLRRILTEILQPLTLRNQSYQVEEVEISILINQLVSEAIEHTAAPSDPEFLSRFAASLLAQPGASVTALLEHIDQLAATIGQRLLETALPERDRLRVGRKLSHQLTLLKMKLTQQNISNQAPILGSIPSVNRPNVSKSYQ